MNGLGVARAPCMGVRNKRVEGSAGSKDWSVGRWPVGQDERAGPQPLSHSGGRVLGDLRAGGARSGLDLWLPKRGPLWGAVKAGQPPTVRQTGSQRKGV